jgi:hypothetical protein
MGFADRDERDLVGLAPRDLGSGGDAAPDVCEQGGWFVHGALL